MGLEYREYMKDDEPGASSGWGGRGMRWDYDIVKALIVTNIVVFILQHFVVPSHNPEGLIPQSLVERYFILDPVLVLKGQIWRLATYDFLHASFGLWHIAFNMLALWVFGVKLQERLGAQEFLAFYLTAGVFAGLGYVIWAAVTQQWNPALGASGAVCGVVVLYALNWPHDQFRIYMLFPVSARTLAIIYACYDLYPLLLDMTGANPFPDGVAHSAHLSGMLFAVIYDKLNLRLIDWVPSRLWRNLTRWAQRPKLRVVRDDAPPVRSAELTAAERRRMDELLDKITVSGEASLSNEERTFLQMASEKLRQRK